MNTNNNNNEANHLRRIIADQLQTIGALERRCEDLEKESQQRLEKVHRLRKTLGKHMNDNARLQEAAQNAENRQHQAQECLNQAEELLNYIGDVTEPGDFICTTCQHVNREIKNHI